MKDSSNYSKISFYYENNEGPFVVNVNEITPDADLFTVFCLQSLQTSELGLQLQPTSKVTSQASFPLVSSESRSRPEPSLSS